MTGPRIKIDHDRVLELWADGMPSTAIADLVNLGSGQKRIGSHTIRTIVQRARYHGDRRAIHRPPSRPKVTHLVVQADLLRRLEPDAERRGLSLQELHGQLLLKIVVDRLADAILDDGAGQ